MGYNKEKENQIWATKWGQKVAPNWLFLSFILDAFLFFIIVPLPAFFQYKGRRLWVTAHYNRISSPPNPSRQNKRVFMRLCACVRVCVCAILARIWK